MAIGQVRTIEKKGLLVLTAQEKSAYMLRIFSIVMQRPLAPSLNYRLMPPRGFWGWATIMSEQYVVRDVQLQFYSQLLYSCVRDDIQNHIVTSSNLSVIAEVLGELTLENPAPPNIIIFPPPPYEPILPPETHIQFVLEPDVVLQVVTQYIPMYATPEVEYDPSEIPPPNGSLDTEKFPPIPPSPPGFPPNTGVPGSGAIFEITPPYDGADDGGKTYVPPFLPPWVGDDGQDEGATYTVTLEKQGYTNLGVKDGTPEILTRTGVPGKIKGLGTNQPSNPDGAYGIQTTNPNSPLIYLGLNYQSKIAWPYPDFTYYYQYKIIGVQKE